MNKALALSLILVSCSGKNLTYSWFENNWVSDADASIAINAEYAELNEVNLQTVKEMYGKIRWNIQGNTMTFLDDRYEQEVEFQSIFKIRPIDSTRFEMMTEAQTNTIWKTESGFCTVPEPDYIRKFDGSRSDLKTECFRRSGT